MSLQFVNIKGQPLTPHQMEVTAKSQRKPRYVAEKEKQHKGFRVVGHSPEAIEKAREANRIEREKDPEVKPFDEVAWRKKTKPKAVRSKPYEIASSAQQCADLAKKGGWLDVEVIALVDPD
jgi:transposase